MHFWWFSGMTSSYTSIPKTLKPLKKACDLLGTIRYVSWNSNFFKVLNFRNTFASHILCTGGWKEFFFFGQWFYFNISNIISKNKEFLSWLVLRFAWFLQTLALTFYIFVQQNVWTLWLLNAIIPFKIKTI